MLTMLRRLASLIPTPATNKVTLFVSDTGIPSYKDDAGLVTPMSGQPIPAGYIDGLKMEWVSGTQIRFTSGSAYIPSLGRALAIAAAVTKSPSLAASTWYHAYLYSNAGTPDVEVTTTAPDTPYSGTSRTKTGDTSRRYIGSFRTDPSGTIAKFKHNVSNGYVAYLAMRDLSLNAGTQTTTTTISLSATIPVTSVAATLIISLDASGASLFTGNSEMPVTALASNNFLGYTESSTQVSVSRMDGHPVDSSQAISYRLSATPSAGTGAYIRVMGYSYER
ncbi:TPA: hypothetical protein ACGCGJ_000388 [Stenotrophomonas maltophilia]|uniref:hypothetical protein n=1 Tax=Stenotrophomonas maltophilia TaxID=40324 RepID=UPI000DA9C08A|nr:hypothetical protein [Stenotrophomonas maltophilia]PZS96314.1 hypothetical protein A7X66_09100 [Stenotrophomonas maltophilia]